MEQNEFDFYEEKYVLKKVLNHPIFAKFYKNERGKILTSIEWMFNKNPTSIMRFGTFDNNWFISFNEIPINMKNSFDVAHEIQHIICCNEGYPALKANEGFPKYQEVARYINNMIHDPIVNGKLVTYGFDLTKYLESGYKIYRENIRLNIQNYYQIIFYKTLYIKEKLELENPNNVSEDTKKEFFEWCERTFYKLENLTDDIYLTIKRIGCSSPQKVHEIFEEVLKMLNLSEKIKVTYF